MTELSSLASSSSSSSSTTTITTTTTSTAAAAAATTSTTGVPSLLALAPIDQPDDWEQYMLQCYTKFQLLVANKTDREAHELLVEQVSKSSGLYNEVMAGSLFSMLVQPAAASSLFRQLLAIQRDQMRTVLQLVSRLVCEKWIKCSEQTCAQVVWFCRELIKAEVGDVDQICQHLLRCVAGGDLTPRNLWLAEALVDLFVEYRPWFDQSPSLIGLTPIVHRFAMFTFLRLIPDHRAPQFAALFQKECEFCAIVLRQRWADCMVIGRDLVRLLINVARVPQFAELWQLIIDQPTMLAPEFEGIAQILRRRTSRKFIVSRLTQDMENKIAFLCTQVSYDHHLTHLEWFKRSYLATPESQSLRVDIIRYICSVIHPTNDMLNSNVVPRWAVIGNLLTSCTSTVVTTSAKLALFYDWLFYDSSESIMLIEPAALETLNQLLSVMFHSMKTHGALSATLLDFICRIPLQFEPSMRAQLLGSVQLSFQQIVRKGVLPSLRPLLRNPNLDRELYLLAKERLAPIWPELEGDKLLLTDSLSSSTSEDGADMGRFSDEEDDLPTAAGSAMSSGIDLADETSQNQSASVEAGNTAAAAAAATAKKQKPVVTDGKRPPTSGLLQQQQTGPVAKKVKVIKVNELARVVQPGSVLVKPVDPSRRSTDSPPILISTLKTITPTPPPSSVERPDLSGGLSEAMSKLPAYVQTCFENLIEASRRDQTESVSNSSKTPSPFRPEQMNIVQQLVETIYECADADSYYSQLVDDAVELISTVNLSAKDSVSPAYLLLRYLSLPAGDSKETPRPSSMRNLLVAIHELIIVPSQRQLAAVTSQLAAASGVRPAVGVAAIPDCALISFLDALVGRHYDAIIVYGSNKSQESSKTNGSDELEPDRNEASRREQAVFRLLVPLLLRLDVDLPFWLLSRYVHLLNEKREVFSDEEYEAAERWFLRHVAEPLHCSGLFGDTVKIFEELVAEFPLAETTAGQWKQLAQSSDSLSSQ